MCALSVANHVFNSRKAIDAYPSPECRLEAANLMRFALVADRRARADGLGPDQGPRGRAAASLFELDQRRPPRRMAPARCPTKAARSPVSACLLRRHRGRPRVLIGRPG